MARNGRIAIRGIDEPSPVARVIREHATGERKVRALVDYQTRPLDFLVDVLKIPRHTLAWSTLPEYATHQWDGTPDPLVRLCDVLAGHVPGKRHVAIEAATGTQKTYTAGALVIWFLSSFEDSLVVTTATIEKQLKQGLWKEIGGHLPHFRREFPKALATDLKIRMRPFTLNPFEDDDSTLRQEKWAAIGWCAGVDANAESAVRSQGFHAEHMLVIVEEMPGVDPAVVTALRNTCTAPHNIMVGLGNPDNQLDPLHVFSELPGVEAIRISAFDHPNVVCQNPNLVPGATSREFIEAKRDEYGDDGPLYLSRVRGLSPREAHNALFKLAWLEEAARKFEDEETRAELAQGAPALGVDPAQSENGDRMALAYGRGAVLLNIDKANCRHALEFGRFVHGLMELEDIAPEHVGVDDVGVGSNVANYLRDVLSHGRFVHLIHGGADEPLDGVMKTDVSTPVPGGHEYRADANRFKNMRAQVYWQLAQDLAKGLVAIPRHPRLWRELMAIRYKTDSGVVQLDPKAEIKKRLGCSPDFSDAAAYWNWVRPRSEPRARPGTAPRKQGQAARLVPDHHGRLAPEQRTDYLDTSAVGLVGAMLGTNGAPPRSAPHTVPTGRYRIPRR